RVERSMSDSLYDSFIADYYDESPIVKGRVQDVAFYRNAARDFGDPILELGCGTGRITMALAEAGKRITVLDLSGRMLERAVKKRAAFHRAEQRNDVEMSFSIKHQDGRQERLVIAWPLRYFFRYEVEHLLARCGFKVAALYGDFDRSPIRDDSPEMIFVTETR